MNYRSTHHLAQFALSAGFLAFCAAMSQGAHAEGSYQIGLNQPYHDYSSNDYRHDQASKSLYVDVLTVGEVINVSLCGGRNRDNVSVAIYAPSDDTTPAFSESFTDGNVDCSDPFDSPLTTPSRYTTSEVGTYRLVLENDSGSLLERVDVSITPDIATDPDPTIAAGRVWAYQYSFATGGFGMAQSTDADYFALVPGGRPNTDYIWKLDLNKFSGNGYDLVANSTGVEGRNAGFSTPSSGNAVSYEHPLYLGVPAVANPAPLTPPTISNLRFVDDEGIDNSISPEATSGVQDTGVFTFSTDVTGNYRMSIDVNQDQIFGNAGDTVLLGRAVAGTNEVIWDGVASDGSNLALGTYAVQAQVTTGEFHFISNDVETSGGDDGDHGLTIFAADQAGNISDTLVYWDDVTVLGESEGGTSNTPTGVLSSSAEARHTWGNFGSGGFGNYRFIDTYTYGDSVSVSTVVEIVETDEPPGTAPVASTVTANTDADTTIVVPLQSSVTDVDSDVALGTIDLDPSTPAVDRTRNTSAGTWTVDEAGALSFDPVERFDGVARIDYAVADDKGNVSAPADIAITVREARPVASADSAVTVQGSSVTVSLVDNVSGTSNEVDISTIDLDASTPGIQRLINVAGEGTYNVANGQLTFNPIVGFSGVSTIDYLISDTAGALSNSASVEMLVRLDSDADGIPDVADLDDDNDGITDADEGNGDADNDGVLNRLDLDSDNDGLSDTIEANGTDFSIFTDTNGDGLQDELAANPLLAPDTDGDNVVDFLDLDSDNDGISDSLELAGDRDADGIANFRDLDVDNDGIFDLVEAHTSIELINQLDTDNDGMVDIANAYGANGMADIIEVAVDSGAINYRLPDTDSDGVRDYRDLDSDNDGILDAQEAGLVDADRDGMADADQPGSTDVAGNPTGIQALPVDTDQDSIADFRDGDSDNDTILDVIESFGTAYDLDGNGRMDNFVDSDGNGVDDNWQASVLAPTDSDNDGLIDAIEIDSDSDGITDIFESGATDVDHNGIVDAYLDSNLDGIDDAVATVPAAPVDSDADGAPDFQDVDSDNDGLTDLQEADAIDANGDGMADELVSTDLLRDENADGTPDFQEVPAGKILTGLSGNGCSIAPRAGAAGSHLSSVDPSLMALGLFALSGLAMRRRRQAAKPGGNA